MPILTVRNLSDEVHRALRARAARRGRSMEAEVRAILEAAVVSQERQKMGSLLEAFGRKLQMTDEEVAILESVRDRAPAEPPTFE